jgi:hypothetical protein
MEYNLQKMIRDIAMCIDFMMLEVKVPIIFPARVVFRYAGIDVALKAFYCQTVLIGRRI